MSRKKLLLLLEDNPFLFFLALFLIGIMELALIICKVILVVFAGLGLLFFFAMVTYSP